MMNEIQINLILVSILLVCAALVSCFETSITAASRAKIHRKAKDGDKRAKKIEKLLLEREKVVSVMLIANNIINILASVLTTQALLKLFGEVGLVYATIFLTVIIIIFGEILPKTLAIKHPEKIITKLSILIIILLKIFSPFVVITQKISSMVINLFSSKAGEDEGQSEFEEIRDTIDLKAQEGSIVKYDKDLIDGVLDLSDTEISEIMVHRKDISSLDIEQSITSLIKEATDIGYSRIPLWKGNNENIIGILNVKKLLKELHFYNGKLEDFNLKKVTSKPWYVPSSNSLKAQIFAFRRKKKTLSLVVDEYGSFLGLVTLEDILEEIIGEVKEQDDVNEVSIIKTRSGSHKITGKTLIRDINKKLDWQIEEGDDAYSLSAFLVSKIERVPENGESFKIDGYHYEILSKKHHEILIVKVKKLLNK